MTARSTLLSVALAALPALAAGQAAPAAASANPIADGLRMSETRNARILVAAVEAMPADKLGYKPTPAQMSVRDIALHLADANDLFCANLGGATAPTRTKMDSTAAKDSVVARLKSTFDFCGTALAKVDDSKLGEQVPFFGDRKTTRGNLILVTVADWADHYSQLAIYLRLNGQLPPTAQPRNP
jgi:uncharacterized damage-inducible protein DinB